MKSALKITLLYLFFGIIWIILSDSIADHLFGDSKIKESSSQLIKGLFYVCTTGFLLYFLINQYQKKLEEKVKELKRLNVSLEIEKEKIKASNEQLENFADVASHDLKSPLRTISTLIQRFKVKFKDHLNEDSAKYLEIIEDSSQKLNEKISETLRFSKTHHFKDAHEIVDLNELLQSIENNIRTIIDEKDAKINYPNLPLINSSKILLHQVFQNLIDNAIKYSKDDNSPTIDVNCKEFDSYWQFDVKDNGFGIDKENHQTIFDKYFRINDETEGSGIGLSIVKDIIEKLHGKIWVESSLGKGTSIYFNLPKNLN
jgi:two-component system CheB/CheR fusion protein